MKVMNKMLAGLLAIVLLLGAVCIPATAEDEIPLIDEGQWYVSLNAGEVAICGFIPKSTTQYYVGSYTSGTPASQYAVLDENGNALKHEKNGLSFAMEADETYYILIGFWSESQSGRIDFQIYDEAIPITSSTNEIITLSGASGEYQAWYTFTPNRMTYYTFWGEHITWPRDILSVTLYNSTGKILATYDYDGHGFEFGTVLQKGMKYYFMIQYNPDAYNYSCKFAWGAYRYPDVRANTWYYEAVSYVSGKAYMTGYGSGYFGPADNLQRQDFVVTLARVAGADLTPYKNADGGLSDVVAGSYYAPAVAWAVDNGIITGYQNGGFGVGDTVTREQVATILYRLKESPAVENAEETLSTFPDSARVSAFATDALAWAVENGVISGMQSGEISPTAGASRAQIATILMRMDQNGLL